MAVWGLVLGSLLIGVATVAAVTATAWVNGAPSSPEIASYRVLPRSSAENPDALTSLPQRTICSLMFGRSCGPVSAVTS